MNSPPSSKRPLRSRRIAIRRPPVALLLLLLLGCSSQPAPLIETPQPDPATATDSYWLAQPATASVFATDYDQLWNICGDVARDDQFSLDRQDYRDGLLTTHPMISKQIFEVWRSDAGDLYSVEQSSLASIRRTITFQFDKRPDGCLVTPKVVVQRRSRQSKRITSVAEYRAAFAKPTGEETQEYWYAIGRDLAMEGELAKSIQDKITR